VEAITLLSTYKVVPRKSYLLLVVPSKTDSGLEFVRLFNIPFAEFDEKHPFSSEYAWPDEVLDTKSGGGVEFPAFVGEDHPFTKEVAAALSSPITKAAVDNMLPPVPYPSAEFFQQTSFPSFATYSYGEIPQQTVYLSVTQNIWVYIQTTGSILIVHRAIITTTPSPAMDVSRKGMTLWRVAPALSVKTGTSSWDQSSIGVSINSWRPLNAAGENYVNSFSQSLRLPMDPVYAPYSFTFQDSINFSPNFGTDPIDLREWKFHVIPSSSKITWNFAQNKPLDADEYPTSNVGNQWGDYFRRESNNTWTALRQSNLGAATLTTDVSSVQTIRPRILDNGYSGDQVVTAIVECSVETRGQLWDTRYAHIPFQTSVVPAQSYSFILRKK